MAEKKKKFRVTPSQVVTATKAEADKIANERGKFLEAKPFNPQQQSFTVGGEKVSKEQFETLRGQAGTGVEGFRGTLGGTKAVNRDPVTQRLFAEQRDLFTKPLSQEEQLSRLEGLTGVTEPTPEGIIPPEELPPIQQQQLEQQPAGAGAQAIGQAVGIANLLGGGGGIDQAGLARQPLTEAAGKGVEGSIAAAGIGAGAVGASGLLGVGGGATATKAAAGAATAAQKAGFFTAIKDLGLLFIGYQAVKKTAEFFTPNRLNDIDTDLGKLGETASDILGSKQSPATKVEMLTTLNNQLVDLEQELQQRTLESTAARLNKETITIEAELLKTKIELVNAIQEARLEGITQTQPRLDEEIVADFLSRASKEEIEKAQQEYEKRLKVLQAGAITRTFG